MSANEQRPYEPEEVLAIFEAREYGGLSRVADRLHRNFTVCCHKRQAARDAALKRRQMPNLWLPDDGMPFAALMVRLRREHGK